MGFPGSFYSPPVTPAAGVVREGIGWRVVQLFYHIKNGGGLLLMLMECRKFDTGRYPITPRTPHVTIVYQEEQHIQPIGIKEYKQGTLRNRFLLIRQGK
jgi:hypothetical protein